MFLANRDSCDLEVAQDCVAHVLHIVELLACGNVMLCIARWHSVVIALLPLWQYEGHYSLGYDEQSPLH